MKQPQARAAAPTPHPIQILLADDHAVLRSGLRQLLDAQPGLHVVGEAATGEEAVEQARALKPDVVVMDLVMPGMGGLEALRRIAGQERGAKILVLTGQPKEQVLLEVLEAGGSGYVNKMSSSDDMPSAAWWSTRCLSIAPSRKPAFRAPGGRHDARRTSPWDASARANGKCLR